jgi:hypothetical protein
MGEKGTIYSIVQGVQHRVEYCCDQCKDGTYKMLSSPCLSESIMLDNISIGFRYSIMNKRHRSQDFDIFNDAGKFLSPLSNNLCF